MKERMNISDEIDYCYYLNKIIENSEELEYLENTLSKIDDNILKLDKPLYNQIENYKRRKKSIIKIYFLFTLSLVGVAKIIDYFALLGKLIYFWYAYSIVKPVAMLIAQKYVDKKDFNKKINSIKEEIKSNKYDLEYARWINEIKLENFDQFDCLNNDEWKKIEQLDNQLVFQKTFFDD